jgi:hypothetical protein
MGIGNCTDLLTWKDPKKTGIVFVTGNLLFISLCFYSFISLISLFVFYLCVAGIALNAVYRFVAEGK